MIKNVIKMGKFEKETQNLNMKLVFYSGCVFFNFLMLVKYEIKKYKINTKNQ